MNPPLTFALAAIALLLMLGIQQEARNQMICIEAKAKGYQLEQCEGAKQ